MKKSSAFFTFIIGSALLFPLSASAFSFDFPSFEEKSPVVEKFVDALFQGNRLGAALVGEVTSLSTSTGIMNLSAKQKIYTILVSPAETKVRKYGLPEHFDAVKAGDKVSVVSSVSKNEKDKTKLKAKIINILSQENESKYRVDSTTTDSVATSSEEIATTTDKESSETLSSKKDEKKSVKEEKSNKEKGE
jgi:hypothetical protein